MNDFEKRWQRISQLLAMEATGKERPMFSSGRTLFGIKSSVEEKMDQFAREIEEEQAAKRKAAHAVTQKDATTHKDADSADGTPDSATKSSSNYSLESGYSPNKSAGTGADKANDTGYLAENAAGSRFVASNAYIRSSVQELTERALKQAIRDANAKLEEDYKSGKITKRKKFNEQ